MSTLSEALLLHALNADREKAFHALLSAAVVLMDAQWGTQATAKYLRDLADALERSQISLLD